MTAFRDRHPHLTLIAAALVVGVVVGVATLVVRPADDQGCSPEDIALGLVERSDLTAAERAPWLRRTVERCGGGAMSDGIRLVRQYQRVVETGDCAGVEVPEQYRYLCR